MKNLIQSFFQLFALSLFTSTLYAKVGPVVPGQALWCIDNKIESTTGVIESKVSAISFSQLEQVLSSEINTILGASEATSTVLANAISQLETLSLCSTTEITTPTTIATSGVYCLNNNIVGAVVVQASDVVINLNSHVVSGNVAIANNQARVMVHNGVIDNKNAQGTALSAGAGTSDIKIQNVVAKNALIGIGFNQVTDGLIEGCTLTQNTTGILLNLSHKIVIEESIAHGNQNAGFDVLQSTTCCFTDCKALSTGAGNTTTTNNSVLGFVATSGYGNIFERCIANSTQALLTTDFSSLVAGFLLRGSESGTKIIECESSNATASASGVTVPYGILLQEQVTSLPLVISINPGGAYGSDDAIFTLAWSPNGKYLAIGGQINPSSTSYYTLIIYQFDYVKMALTQIIATNVFGNGASDQVTSVAWSPDGRYLAVGGTLSPFRATNDFIIYQFDSINQAITQIQGFQITTVSTGGMYITWSPDGKYVLVGGGTVLVNDNDILLYKFDSVAQTAALVQAITLTSSNYVAQIGWSPDGSYVAAGGNLSTVGNNLQLYSFNKGTQTLSFVDTENTVNNVSSLAWSPNGQYLGVGGNFTANADFQMYQLNRTTQKLQLITSVTFPRTDVVESIAWSSDGQYVTITGNIYGTGDLVIYRFDPGVPSLTRVAGVVEVPSFSGGLFCSWSPDGQYIATGGFLYGAPERNLNIYQALTFPPNNIIKSNTVYCNSGGSLPNGIGISGSSIANMIIQNTAYSNPVNEFMVPANYAFATNVFNSLFGQAPTMLQNISVDCCAPNCMQQDIGLTLKQAYYNLNTAENNLSVISNILEMLTTTNQCSPTSVTTSPTTLTGPGIYCIANDSINGLITINGSDVVLDLNNYTVTGGINVASNGNRITIKHGIVSQGGSNAITINAGCSDVTIQNVMAKNSIIGIQFNSVTRGLIDGCTLTQNTTGMQLNVSHNITVQETKADTNRSAGFDLIASTTCCFTDCKALSTGAGNATVSNNTVVGFVSTSGYGNVFERCIANSTQALLTTDFSSLVAGFVLRGTEVGSKIIACESSNATANQNGVTVPYGILLQEQVTSLPLITSINPGGALGSFDSLVSVAWSPDGKYLAMGGQVNQGSTSVYTLLIYQFDYLKKTLTQIIAMSSGSASDTLTSVAWSPNGNYLAVGGTLSPYRVASDFTIYRFDSTTQTLTQVQGFHITSATTGGFDISWSPDERYLAVGGSALLNENNIQLYKFDAVAQVATLVQTTTIGPSPYDDIATVAWSPDGNYLAAGGNLTAGGNDLQLYSFNRGTQAFTLVDTENTNPSVVSSVAWSPNGKYLAVVGHFTDSNDLKIYQLNRTTQKLQQIVSASFPVTNDIVESVAWSSDGEYVAIAGNTYVAFSNDLVIYKFDPGVPSLTQVAGTNIISPGYTAALFLAWSPDGQYIATVGFGYSGLAINVNIYQALTFPSNNLVKGNTVYCNSGGSTPNGIGISGSSIANMIIQNTAYANPINEFMVPTNYAFAQNVFNQLFGQGPSLLQNTSLGYREPISEPADLGLILEQILYQTDDLSCPQTIINSQSIVGGTISITAGGAYCMAQDLTAQMIISTTGASIDMNNRILYGSVTIQSSQDVSLVGGRVEPSAPTTSGQASVAAITIASTAVRTKIVGLTIFCADTTTNGINGLPGIQISGNDSLISNCTIKSGAGAANNAGAGAVGGTGILLSSGTNRTLIEKCLIRTGNGGNGTTQGGNGGDGISVSSNVTETKIIGCVVLQLGSPGSPLGVTGPQGGNGVVINSGALKTLVTQCIIRNSTAGVGTVSAGALAVDNRSVSTNRSAVYENVAYNIGNSVKYSNFSNSTLDEFGVQLDLPPSNGPLNKIANVFFAPLA